MEFEDQIAKNRFIASRFSVWIAIRNEVELSFTRIRARKDKSTNKSNEVRIPLYASKLSYIALIYT